MEIQKGMMARLIGRFKDAELDLSKITAALDPESTPVTATLAGAEATSEGFESVSSAVPVCLLVAESVDWVGLVVFEIKLGDTWHPIFSDANAVTVPQGCLIRARLESYSAGSIDVKIFQGRAEAE